VADEEDELEELWCAGGMNMDRISLVTGAVIARSSSKLQFIVLRRLNNSLVFSLFDTQTLALLVVEFAFWWL